MFSAASSLLEQFHSNSLKSCTMKKEEKLDGDQHNELEARPLHSARRIDLWPWGEWPWRSIPCPW